jgi:N-acetylmuramoyl-L-alanine amidase-like protein
MFPSLANARKIERRARRIADPVERLRYLRQATGAAPASRPKWRAVAPFLLALVVIPLHTVSDANVRGASDFRQLPPAARRIGADVPAVWLVDKTNEFEMYSNGLRIENRSSVSNEPRWYPLIGRDLSAPWGPRRSQPAGIVFHTTESDQVPFEPDQNHMLKHIGQELLVYLRNRRAYHFLIDRFGRVHRIVVESDAANHAGHSVWADEQWSYINLNASFLSIAFEAHTEPGEPQANAAQIHAAKVLTAMLRSKYNIPAENCVTHAQVSVNPGLMRIGWHTDWGNHFPFEEIGLPDNYQQPIPALSLFGFAYDATYLRSTSAAVWQALALSEEQMRRAAARQGTTVPEYRKLLQKKYRDQVAALKNLSASEEN